MKRNGKRILIVAGAAIVIGVGVASWRRRTRSDMGVAPTDEWDNGQLVD